MMDMSHIYNIYKRIDFYLLNLKVGNILKSHILMNVGEIDE